jgi:hypothetical protein
MEVANWTDDELYKRSQELENRQRVADSSKSAGEVCRSARQT